MKKKYWIVLVILVTVLGGSGYMVFKQHTEKEKMLAIAHSEKAKKVYIDMIKHEDSKAFTNSGIIKKYKVDDSRLDYHPMGGLKVRIVINDNKDQAINFDLIENSDGTYHSAYYTISPKLAEKLGY
ncbi:DUF1310 family protein [Streptococcus iniae]|uniref:DUF1310 family protein n=1 Tax=Streptococcus iniae TaxID=1346 RepID=A0A3L8GPR1_STRIN|nr:DUF1310 family protein [Streptococcus iniae]AJG25235.1 hypothetical protein SI82_01045 [Streptococcus iniae]APD31139.1 hypothetical protein BMF34_01125 [Streptococcus iniae]ASL34059.1 membrane protein [Streptococcus iniae]ATX38957.1 hypothetical protein CTW00_00756 [Streptococcus iniae]AYB02071.1 DUF1310 family protein [Streptococcus iniae]